MSHRRIIPPRDYFTRPTKPLPDFAVEYVRTSGIEFVCVTDLDCGGRSVTNGIDDVIAELHRMDALRPGWRVIYRDSEGTWDEALLDDRLHFRDFRSLNRKSRDEAIARVLELMKDKP